MPDVNLKPFWIGANVPIFTTLPAPVQGVITGARDFLQQTASDLTAQAAKDAQITNRLLAWYDDNTSPADTAQALTDSVADMLEDTWNSGLHWYVTKPGFGGFSLIRQRIAPALQRPTELHAPYFTETMHSGGMLLVFSGPPPLLFNTASMILLLLTGSAQVAQDALGDLVGDSSAMNSISQGLTDLVSLPQAIWSQETQELADAVANSPLGKILSGDAYPLNLMRAATFNIEGIAPTSVKPGGFQNFVITGQGLLANDRVWVAGEFYDPEFVGPEELRLSLPGSLFTQAGMVVLQLQHQGKLFPLGTVEVQAKDPLEALKETLDPAHWDEWHSIQVGDALHRMIPGVATVVEQTIATLDLAGQAAAGIEDFGRAAIKATGDVASRTTQATANSLGRLEDGLGGLVSELGALGAAVLVIPPCEGGNHQLNFALNQGLNGFAANSPPINDDDAVFSIFVCAGGPKDTVITALNTVANLLKIADWPVLS